MERRKDLFVPLKEVAEVRRGFTTGANEFFYLTEEKVEAWGIEKEFWCHNEGEKWVPNYVIKSLKESKTIQVNPNDLKYRVLMIHKDKKELEGTNVLKYIEYGETHKFGKGDKPTIPAQRPTCKSRERWYDLGTRTPGPILYVERMGDRFVVLSNHSNVFVNKNLYEIYPKDITQPSVLCAMLNSTITNLSNELYGRILTGAQNVIDIDVWMTNRIPVIQPNKIARNQIKKLNKAFERLSKRSVEHVLKELGAETPEEVTLDKVKPDRRELDKVIFEILGLTEEEQLEVYRAVVDLVRSRIEKAKSVSRNKNKKKFSEVDLLVKRTLDSLGGEDILKNFFASVGDSEELMLPKFRKEVKIEKTLTGWQLTDGKERVFFDDRKQAEYSRILTTIGMERVKIPKELNEEKVAALKNIVDSVFQALNGTLEMITDKKTREAVKGLVIGKIVSRTNVIDSVV